MSPDDALDRLHATALVLIERGHVAVWDYPLDVFLAAIKLANGTQK